MRRVLVVTFLYPPSGGGGVQRVSRFVRYLPEFGWEPTVVAVQPQAAVGGYWGRTDPALVEGVEVRRTRTWDAWFQRWPGRLAHLGLRAAGLPETQLVSWLPFLLPALRLGGFDAVFSSSPPVTAHVGAALARRAGCRWVADYRDTWTTNPLYRDVSPWHRFVDRALEGWLHRRADAVVTTTPGFRRDLESSFGLAHVHTIPNGYDERDPVAPRAPAGERVLAYVVGNEYRPEILEPLLALLSRARVRVRVIGGALGGRVGEALRATGLVEELPYLPHAELYAELARADAGLVVVPPGPAAEHWVPQKAYLYLHARLPVVALCPRGDLSSLLSSVGGGVAVSSVDEAAALLDRWSTDPSALAVAPAGGPLLAALSRRALTARLAAVLEGRPLAPLEEMWP